MKKRNGAVAKFVTVCVVIVLLVAECAMLSGCADEDTKAEKIIVMLPQSLEYTSESYWEEVSSGDKVTFKVAPLPGYKIIGSSAGVYNNGTLTLNNVRSSVTVHLKIAESTKINANGTRWSFSTKSDYGRDLFVGKRGIISIQPEKNYYIDKAEVNGIVLNEDTEGVKYLIDGTIQYARIMPKSLDLNVTVLGDEYTLSLSHNDKGKVELNVPVGTVHYGDKVRLSAKPAPNCQLSYIHINGKLISGTTYEFSVTEDTLIDVGFVDITAVSLSYDPNGGKIVGQLNGGVYNPNTKLNIDHCHDKILRKGYVLTGMNTKADGSGENYSLGAMMWLYDSPVTLYAQWAKATPTDSFKYTDNGVEATITGFVGVPTGRIVIPEHIEGMPVTSIASKAFYGSAITELVTNPNIVKIESGALENCKSLKKIILFDSLRSVPANMLAGCSVNVRVHVGATSESDKSNLYEGSIVDRWMNIKRKDRRSQLITISGSSGSCGITPKMVIDGLGLEPNIFGVQQQLGIRILMSIIVPHVRKGDIVVLCPEYFKTTYAIEQGRTNINYKFIQRSYDMMPLLDYAENINFFNDLGTNFSAKNPGAIGTNRFNIDEYGQRDNKRPGKYDGWSHAKELVRIQETLIGDGIELMKKYAAVMRANGAKVYFSFPPANSDGWDEYSKSLANRKRFVTALTKALGGEIPIISDMEDYFWRGSKFSDTNFHLSNEGSKLRTAQLIADVKAQLALEASL